MVRRRHGTEQGLISVFRQVEATGSQREEQSKGVIWNLTRLKTIPGCYILDHMAEFDGTDGKTSQN